MSKATSFQVAIPDAQLADLKYRHQHKRWPDAPACAGWTMGTDLSYMKTLTHYWLNT